MATIGHTLVGLSLGELSRADGRGGKLRYAWPGFMILMGHVVDIAEWAVAVAAPDYFDRHFVTNSPLMTSGLVLGLCIILYWGFRLRRPWPYLLTALAVFSHLLLDYWLARRVLLEAYGASVVDGLFLLRESIFSEIWFYGLLLVCVMLGRGAFRQDCPRLGKAAAGLLAAVTIFAAITRQPALWIPAYALGCLHALLLSRRDLSWQLGWSLLPVVPVVALVVVELWAGYLTTQARQMVRVKDYPGAIRMFQNALAVPTRSRNDGASYELASCQLQAGLYADAETTFLRSLRHSETAWWIRYRLATLYLDPKAAEQDLYRPLVALQQIQAVLSDPSAPPSAKEAARNLQREIEAQGLLDPARSPRKTGALWQQDRQHRLQET